jgi:phosphoenolpyruvate synthase/pyruvate phosphate dikinase
MAEPNVTLRDVFELPKDDKPDSEPDRWKAVQERIRKEVKDVKMPAKMHDLGPKICELFDVPLPNILVTSWKKVGSVQAIIEKSRQSPDEVMYLELAQHSINCEQKPHLEMRIKELPVKKIEFLVKLLFNLKGFVLKVQNGAIQEIQTGSCEIKGTVSYAGQVIMEKKLSPINLPGRIDVPALIGLLQPEHTEKARTV